MCSPYLRTAFKVPRWKRILGLLMAKILPKISLASGLEVNMISRIPAIIEAYKVDPLNHDRISAGTYLSMIQAGQWALLHAQELKIPLRLFHGTEDHITDCLASREFSNKAGDLCLFTSINGGYHELLNDLCREQILEEIHQFMDRELNRLQS